jgi:hypothetical protein
LRSEKVIEVMVTVGDSQEHRGRDQRSGAQLEGWPSGPTASPVPTLLKVLVVSGNPFVIACTKTGDELTIRTKAANGELSLFFFGVIGIPFYICSSRYWRSWADVGRTGYTSTLLS